MFHLGVYYENKHYNLYSEKIKRFKINDILPRSLNQLADSFTRGLDSTQTVINGVKSNELDPN